MFQLEVLIGKLLAIDTLSTSALYMISKSRPSMLYLEKAYIATSKITTLEHELRDDSVEA